MRFAHIDHIGIAVEDFDAAVATYTALHGMPPSKIVDVPAEQVRVALFPLGATKIELVAATSPSSPIAKFLAKRGSGLHHVCYAAADFDRAVQELTRDGFQPIMRPHQTGADGCRIAFFHPKTTHGVLIELVEALSK